MLLHIFLVLILLQSVGFGTFFAFMQPVFYQIATYIIQNHERYSHKLSLLEIDNDHEKNYLNTQNAITRINEREIEINRQRYDIVKADSSQTDCVRLLLFCDKSETFLFKLLKKYCHNQNDTQATQGNKTGNTARNYGGFFPLLTWIFQSTPPLYTFQRLPKHNIGRPTTALLPPYIAFWSCLTADVPSPPPKK